MGGPSKRKHGLKDAVRFLVVSICLPFGPQGQKSETASQAPAALEKQLLDHGFGDFSRHLKAASLYLVDV